MMRSAIQLLITGAIASAAALVLYAPTTAQTTGGGAAVGEGATGTGGQLGGTASGTSGQMGPGVPGTAGKMRGISGAAGHSGAAQTGVASRLPAVGAGGVPRTAALGTYPNTANRFQLYGANPWFSGAGIQQQLGLNRAQLARLTINYQTVYNRYAQEIAPFNNSATTAAGTAAGGLSIAAGASAAGSIGTAMGGNGIGLANNARNSVAGTPGSTIGTRTQSGLATGNVNTATGSTLGAGTVARGAPGPAT